MDTLNSLQPGEHARIGDITASVSLRRRLLDIGMIQNTPVECVGQSPAGDPKAFLIRGAVIAIRSEDSRGITVNKISPPRLPRTAQS